MKAEKSGQLPSLAAPQNTPVDIESTEVKAAQTDTRAYLESIYGTTPTGLLQVAATGNWSGWTFRTIAEVLAKVAELEATARYAGIYVRGTTLKHVPAPGKRGENVDTATIYMFALDVDLGSDGHKAKKLPNPETAEEALALITQLGMPAPTRVVHTGGGISVQWLLDAPVGITADADREAAEREWFHPVAKHLKAGFEANGWNLDSCHDLARVWRVPGTTNRKPERSAPASCVVLWTSERRYSPAALAAVLTPSTDPFTVASEAGESQALNAPPSIQGTPWTKVGAQCELDKLLERITSEDPGNTKSGGLMRRVGRFVPAMLTEQQAVTKCVQALQANDRHSDDWNAANGKDWNAASLAAAAVKRGMGEPFEVEKPGPGRPRKVKPKPPPLPDCAPGQLNVTSEADMTYWLQQNIGTGKLAGFFLKDGEVVYTPAEGESGYVALRGHSADGDDGPAQVTLANGPVIAARVQFSYECIGWSAIESENEKLEVEIEWESFPKMFPVKAGEYVARAADAMPKLRPLRSVINTPIIRKDGSLFDTPGYDAATRSLFLPDVGVNVPPVSASPTREEVAKAVAVLDYMVAGFPWVHADDKANYFGFLISPLLRGLIDTSYKMFAINAHQPGSGKSLLADIARIIHGGVLRAEMPEDEAEMRKQITSILATSTGAVIQIDNVDRGVLRSSTLAGLLTSTGSIQDRELGSTRMLKTKNDRVWCVTGNNIALGGDLVRRTVTVNIDPNTDHPEEREFEISDLHGWVTKNRNEILHAMLTMIRGWVAAGRQCPPPRSTDNFAPWATVVSGILAFAGVAGTFDDRSGQKAAKGGDDDGLFSVLEALHAKFGERPFTTAELFIGPEPFAAATLSAPVVEEWFPEPVLKKLGNGGPAGVASAKKAFGHWLRFRTKRWVSDSVHRLCVRDAGRGPAKVQLWSVERRVLGAE